MAVKVVILCILMLAVQCRAINVRSAVLGPYLYLYQETNSWTYIDAICGTRIVQAERYSDDLGDMMERVTYDENDCFDDDYGYTHYYIENYSTTEGYGYMYRIGYLGGGTVYDIYPEPDPNWPYELWPEWFVRNVAHSFDGGSRNFRSIGKATVVIKPGPPTGTKTDQLIGLRVEVWRLVWSETAQWWTSANLVPYNEITVAGITPDCNGLVPILLDNNYGLLDVTPVAPYDYYSFSITPVYPVQVYRTKAHHPNLQQPRSAGALQTEFNNASIQIAAVDNDDCVSDGSNELNDPTVSIEDDVVTLAEFYIEAADQEIFPAPFNQPKFNQILDGADSLALLSANFSQIKLVTSLPWPAVASADGFIGTGSILLSANAGGATLIHEWLHTNFLDHRGDPVNPGTTVFEDQKAILYYQSGAFRNEINRFERNAAYW